ncbi:MAG: HTTM domain-containing protein [Verrucomicrobiaceae bacterium]|nr:HTTM domain-containing protein [Verrucomicrobiaceae bacterium]
MPGNPPSPVTAPASESASGSYDPFSAFALIWAVTTLAHQLAFTFWTESWQGWLLVTAAIAVIYRPGCVLRLGVLVVTSLLNLWHKLPFVPNHILFEGMLHLIMLIALIGFFRTGPGRRELAREKAAFASRLALLGAAASVKALYFFLPGIPHGPVPGALTTLFLLFALCRVLFGPGKIGSGGDYYDRIAPILRVALLIMYIWAVIQKLNWDYFDPEVSCAAVLHKEIAAYFGPLLPTGRWALMTAAVASLLFELGIPLLLFFRKTRFIGFAAAIGFHLWLSIHPAAGIFSFTSLILAMLVFFLPLSWGVRLQGLWDGQLRWLGRGDPAKGRKRARALVVGVFFVTLITQGALYLTIERSYEVFHTANRIGFFAFFLWGCWIGACYLLAGWKARKDNPAALNRARWTLAWLGLLPVVLNGAYPWLGGRTQTSFSMYSNLRSEGEGNHFFLKRIDLFSLQTDMVDVRESVPNILGPSSRPRGIQQFANIGHHLLPWHEFRRLVSEMEGDFEVRYFRRGEELALGRKNGERHGDPAAFEPLPLLQRKFLWFRRLQNLEGPMCCTH